MIAPRLELRPCLGESEYPVLVHIWRSAVDATHDFVRPEHLDAIEARLPTEYFPNVDLTVALADDRPVGFAGVADSTLEMMFVDNSMRGRGVGAALLSAVSQGHGELSVDVNEQNTQAVGFYKRQGFAAIGRSPVDGDGLPYPLVHLRISQS